ncbi:hypothetical protein DSO57_1030227 [Entomophthora muscae]|uniref:Uncharacterized protein n=1 Tax=Entomophthora muscae TaxID=34485 RepID=A0ACC2TZK8_9FUNG|nr:hypothetical protein DSO57_1030227 [Entomophthora muscae]
MASEVLVILLDFLLILVAAVPNVILFLVTLRHPSKNIDIKIIRIISIFDLLCVLSLFLEACVSLVIYAFSIMYEVEKMYILNNSLISMPGAMLGMSLAAILSVVRCMAIVFRVRANNRVVHCFIVALALYIFSLCTVSYLRDDMFYGDKLLLRIVNPRDRWSWYTCSDISIFTLSILAIVISYIFIIHHYYSLRHLCELQGIYLEGTIVGIIITVILYTLAILPRLALTFIRQLNPNVKYAYIGANCLLIFYGLPTVNAIFSLLLHEETRRLAMDILNPNRSRVFQTFEARPSVEDQSSLVT